MRTLLVTVDSLRFDAFSEHMPITKGHLDWIHGNAYSTGPNTGEAFPAIIGGVYPRKIGLPPGTSIANEFETYTAGVSTNHLLSAKYGYDEGFDSFTSPNGDGGGVKDRAARIVTQGSTMYRLGAKTWNFVETLKLTSFQPSFRPATLVIEDFDRIRRAHDDWFVWLHFMEPHHPYEPPTAEDRLGARQLSRSVIAGAETTPEERERVRSCYQQEVKALDGVLKGLWNSLAADTRVVFCADHGELMGEGGKWGHVGCFRPEVLHVPAGGKNLPEPGELLSLVDVPSLLLGDEHNQGTFSRDVAYATNGREWAAIDGQNIARPDGVFDLNTDSPREDPALQRAQATFDVKTGALEHADEEELKSLGYL